MYASSEVRQTAEAYAVWVILSGMAIDIQTPRKADDALERQLVACALAGWKRTALPAALTQADRDVLRHLRRMGGIDAKDRPYLHPIEDWFFRMHADSERGQRIAVELAEAVHPAPKSAGVWPPKP